MVPCKWLYRNKPKAYFDEIIYWKGGLMEATTKDQSGDPRSPINGRIKGIFFTASVKRGSIDGELIEKSPYGSSRFQVSIKYIKHIFYHNLYFADFYCAGSNYHYVILVIAQVNSESDIFCRRNLMILQWSNNAFLTDDGCSFYVNDTSCCVIEVMYANDVNLVMALAKKEARLIDNIPTFGRNPKVVRKSPRCPVCNIHPLWTKSDFYTNDCLQLKRWVLNLYCNFFAFNLKDRIITSLK